MTLLRVAMQEPAVRGAKLKPLTTVRSSEIVPPGTTPPLPPPKAPANLALAEPPAPQAAQHQASVAPVTPPRIFELDKVELLKLSNINVAASTFKAQIYIQCVVRGAANDEDFCKEGIVFPIGSDGKPTFRPSAGWFLDKLEFCNGEGTVKMLDKLQKTDGDDVYLSARWEGVFFERFELHDFPFDLQALTMSLSINCRSTGPIPAIWTHTEATGTVVSSDEQLLGDAWTLKLRSLMLRSHLVGFDADRLFPTISISAIIQRQSHYFVTNGVVPFGLFSLMSMLQFCLHLKLRNLSGSAEMSSLDQNSDSDGESLGGGSDVAIMFGHINHRSQMTLMLVFTCATYKMAIGGRMPAVAYLTLLDKYMLLNSLYVVLVAFQSRLVSLIVDTLGPQAVGQFDRYSAIAFGAAWLALQTWFTLRARHLKMMARPREETLDGNPEFLTLWKPNDEPHLLARANRAAKKVGKRAKEAGKQAKRRILPPA